MNRKAQSFEDLEVYRNAMDLQQLVFEISKSFPREEMYALTDQIRRASRSIGANIAESWAKRRYPSHFVSKLTDADAEQMETRHWNSTAQLCGYITQEQADDILTRCKKIGSQLGRILTSPESWKPREQ